MKYTFIILAFSFLLIPSGCRNKKIESLERKNDQLLVQIDSLKLAIENQKKINQIERIMADSNAMVSKRMLDECQKKNRK